MNERMKLVRSVHFDFSWFSWYEINEKQTFTRLACFYSGLSIRKQSKIRGWGSMWNEFLMKCFVRWTNENKQSKRNPFPRCCSLIKQRFGSFSSRKQSNKNKKRNFPYQERITNSIQNIRISSFQFKSQMKVIQSWQQEDISKEKTRWNHWDIRIDFLGHSRHHRESFTGKIESLNWSNCVSRYFYSMLRITNNDFNFNFFKFRFDMKKRSFMKSLLFSSSSFQINRHWRFHFEVSRVFNAENKRAQRFSLNFDWCSLFCQRLIMQKENKRNTWRTSHVKRLNLFYLFEQIQVTEKVIK